MNDSVFFLLLLNIGRVIRFLIAVYVVVGIWTKKQYQDTDMALGACVCMHVYTRAYIYICFYVSIRFMRVLFINFAQQQPQNQRHHHIYQLKT
jgi:hypothetical protein